MSSSLDKSLEELISEQRNSNKSTSAKRAGSSVPRSVYNVGGSNGNGKSRGTHVGTYRSSSCRCFVGNLSYDTRWQSLKDHMRLAGDVINAEVYFDPMTNKPKGYGIVEYSSRGDASNAIDTLNDTILDDRLIFVREDREEERHPVAPIRRDTSIRSRGKAAGRGDTGKKIFIGNLPFSYSWQDLKDKFSELGKIIRADILTKEGLSMGSGVVLYEERDSAIRAIEQFNGITLDGRNISVRWYND